MIDYGKATRYECSRRKYNKEVSNYLEENKIRDPISDGTSVYHILDGANILTEPIGSKISITVDTENEKIFGDLEKLLKKGKKK